MKKIVFFYVLVIIFLSVAGSHQAAACESCSISSVGKHQSLTNAAGPWRAGFVFEEQNWDELPAREAHQLHHRGHHFHDKTHEEFIHLMLERDLTDRLSLSADLPYVVRGSIEIDDHDRLGEKETSEGLGDTNFLGTYELLIQEKGYFGAVAGVKLPTGSTSAENSQDVLFESELQPGTGSWDFPLGVSFECRLDGFTLRGNAVYVIKTEGRRDFEAGDLFSTSLFVDTPLSSSWSAGVDFNFQHEEKQREDGVRIADSGGVTMLLGPSLRFTPNPRSEIFGAILLPVYQNLGGVHQELDFIWTVGAKVSW